MKKWYKLDNIANFEGINNFFKATGTPTLEADAEPIVLWTENDFEDIFDKQCFKSIYLHETSMPWEGFKEKYTRWINRNKDFIANEMYTLYKKFNPIHNYDRHEEYSGDDTTTKTPDNWTTTRTEEPDDWKRTETQKPTSWQVQRTHGFTDYTETTVDTPEEWQKVTTDEPENWKKTTETEGQNTANQSDTTNSVIPFNGSSFEDVNKSVTHDAKKIGETQAGKYEVTEEQTGTFTRELTKNGTETITDVTSGQYATEITETGKRTETTEQTGTLEDKIEYGKVVDISGNIGVTTTSAMIMEVVKLYDIDFVDRWLKRFFDEYCYYVKE